MKRNIRIEPFPTPMTNRTMMRTGRRATSLRPASSFLELEDGYRPNTWNRDAYLLEKKLLEYCAGRDITLDQCYTFKTDKHHLIFMSVQEEQDDWEKPYAYIMYIDIGPITRYIVTLNWAFFRGAAGDLLRHVPAGVPVWP